MLNHLDIGTTGGQVRPPGHFRAMVDARRNTLGRRQITADKDHSCVGLGGSEFDVNVPATPVAKAPNRSRLGNRPLFTQ
jgi:hypothetical protein